jgi:hypothetical protein
MSNKPKRTRKQVSRKKPTKSSELALAPESTLPPEPLQTPEPAPTEHTETPELAPISEVPAAEPVEPTPTPEPPQEPTATQEQTPILEPETEPSPKQEEQPARKAKNGGFGSFFKYIGKRPPKYVPKQRPPKEPAPEVLQTPEPAQEPIPEPVIVTKPNLTTSETTQTPTQFPESTPATEPVPVSAVSSEPVPTPIAKLFPTPEPMPERLPEPKQEPKKQPKARKPKLVKAYMRNLGKGKLKFQDESIKFYTEKGTFNKERQLAKQIELSRIDSATLDKKKNELTIRFQDETETFVIKDKLYAKILLGKIDQALFMRESLPPPTPEPALTSNAIDVAFGVEKPVPKDYKKTLTTALSVVDSLFDILMCLQGRVDWATIDKNAEFCEKDYPKVTDRTTMETANLDLSLLVSAATDHNVELTSEEATRLLESLYNSLLGAESKFPLSSKAVTPYYILNDVVLGIVVGDPAIEEELNQLRAILADLAGSTGMNVGEVVEAANRIVKEQLKEPYTEQARNFFRQQLLATVSK